MPCLQAALPLFRASIQQTSPTNYKLLPSWVTHDPSLKFHAAPTDQSGLVQNCEFSFSIWSLPSRDLHSRFDSETKREILSKTLF